MRTESTLHVSFNCLRHCVVYVIILPHWQTPTHIRGRASSSFLMVTLFAAIIVLTSHTSWDRNGCTKYQNRKGLLNRGSLLAMAALRRRRNGLKRRRWESKTIDDWGSEWFTSLLALLSLSLLVILQHNTCSTGPFQTAYTHAGPTDPCRLTWTFFRCFLRHGWKMCCLICC